MRNQRCNTELSKWKCFSILISRLMCMSLFGLLILPTAHSQLYRDASQPLEVRVRDLLSRMTPEEKFWQVFMVPSDGQVEDGRFRHGVFGLQIHAAASGDAGGQMLNYNSVTNAVESARTTNRLQRYFVTQTRLGIPIIPFDEALHGLVRQGCTAFPQSIGLAASFDTSLVSRVANQITRECRVRGIRQILSPVVNLAGDPRWGRTEETYGEDPLLSSAMGIAFMLAFERSGIITTPKHFVANHGDGGRDSYPVAWSEKYLDRTHFVPFIEAIHKAGARSVMSAYNSLDGTPCSASKWLLTEKLKDEWGFKGFVISDANAVGGEVVLHMTAQSYAESGAHAINAGLDVIFQTDHRHAALFYPAFEQGLVDAHRLDDAVSRVLRAKFELGLFENPYVPEPDTLTLMEGAGDLATLAAEKSFVLLKNEKNILPLKQGNTKVAVFGYDAAHARLGGYSGPGNHPVTILEGLSQTFEVTGYEEGAHYRETYLTTIDQAYLKTDKKGGLYGEYYNNPTLTGKPVTVRTDEKVDFSWTLSGPSQATGNDFYSVRWTGSLIAPETREYQIGIEGNDGYRIYIDGVLMADRWQKTGYHRDIKKIQFKKGSRHDLRIEFFETKGNGRIRLLWDYGITNHDSRNFKKAVALAKKSDVAIMVAGIHEGEFQDRASLKLPGRQAELIKALKITGKPVIVLLVGGSAITMDEWIESADAVVCLWYPGEKGGHAVANLLSGKANPAARLPLTFPDSESQLPLTYNHLPTGRGDDYHDMSGEPAYPFGFGLSYSSFEYLTMQQSLDTLREGNTTTLSITIQNTGSVEGDEVVQIYAKPVYTIKAQPVLQLVGFQRVTVPSGSKKTLTFDINGSMFSHNYGEERCEIYSLFAGSSSRNLRLKTSIFLK